jgi:hypothetical protein
MKTSLKDWPKVYRKISGMRGMTRAEKIRIAMGLAATPEEMWQTNVERCKLLGVWGAGLAGKRKLERLVVAGKDWLPEFDTVIPRKVIALRCAS